MYLTFKRLIGDFPPISKIIQYRTLNADVRTLKLYKNSLDFYDYLIVKSFTRIGFFKITPHFTPFFGRRYLLLSLHLIFMKCFYFNCSYYSGKLIITYFLYRFLSITNCRVQVINILSLFRPPKTHKFQWCKFLED